MQPDMMTIVVSATVGAIVGGLVVYLLATWPVRAQAEEESKKAKTEKEERDDAVSARLIGETTEAARSTATVERTICEVRSEQDKSEYQKRLETIRRKHPNAYSPWDSDEEERLAEMWRSGMSVKQMSDQLGRQTGGVRSRLAKLGFDESPMESTEEKQAAERGNDDPTGILDDHENNTNC